MNTTYLLDTCRNMCMYMFTYAQIHMWIDTTCIFDTCIYTYGCTYRVAKTHRMPYLYRSFSAKEPDNL